MREEGGRQQEGILNICGEICSISTGALARSVCCHTEVNECADTIKPWSRIDPRCDTPAVLNNAIPRAPAHSSRLCGA